MSFKENIQANATKVLEFIKDKESTTSWQIKVALNISNSAVFLALGLLVEQNKISVEPSGLNYKVSKIQ